MNSTTQTHGLRKRSDEDRGRSHGRPGIKKARRLLLNWRRYGRPALILVFFAAVAWLLAGFAKSIEWDKVGDTLRNYQLSVIFISLALAAAGYLVCSSYDLLGRSYVGHRLSTARVMAINFVGYSFALNLGATVGGIGFRYRLYSRFGLKPLQTTKIVALSVITNWSGYALLAGAVFTLMPPSLPDKWQIGDAWAIAYGCLSLGLVVAYAAICLLWKNRQWRIRGRPFKTPSMKIVSLQLALSTVSWALIAANINYLLPDSSHYGTALTAVLMGAIASVMLHIPAGLGVLEAIFVVMMPGIAASEVVAAVLVHRMVYQVAPLLVAVALYLTMELQGSAHKRLEANQ